jgi:hypothetical protein
MYLLILMNILLMIWIVTLSEHNHRTSKTALHELITRWHDKDKLV